MTETSNPLDKFGFKSERGGAHSSRTIMLDELRGLISYVDDPSAGKEAYQKAIEEDNCLGKRSGKTRTLTFRHLVDLYSLDHEKTIFRALLYFWKRDPAGQAQLALLCAYSRDSIFRATAPAILKNPVDTIVSRDSVEELIDDLEPGRFSKATLKSTAQNINSSLTKSGHLTGRNRKVRTEARPSVGSVCYALLLGYLTGIRGQSLFHTEYIKMLDCSYDRALELAEEASRKGWIILKRVGDVIEVLFPNLINQQEMEWLREQN